MIADLSDSILTPAAILWIIAVVIAATLLFGSINRRRSRLTDTLRNYVDRNAIEKRPPTGSAETKPNGNDD
jgi:hypothetical protein